MSLRTLFLVVFMIFPFPSTNGSAQGKKMPEDKVNKAGNLVWSEGKEIKGGIDPLTSYLSQMETRSAGTWRSWLNSPMSLMVRNEATNHTASLTQVHVKETPQGVSVCAKLEPLSLEVSQLWTPTSGGLAWELSFMGNGPRAAHEVILELPVLSPTAQVFTPSNRGVMQVSDYPTFNHAPYATYGLSWEVIHAYYVLPLVSIFNTNQDSALTIALPADVQIPHLQVSWTDSRNLRLTLAHRGMGGGRASPLKLLFYTHAADYRSVLKVYSDDFPRYFRPTLPRSRYEGAFYYHHIQDHPPLEEMARQQIRYIWTFPWFTHVGEYLPKENEWIPYSYSNWWRLGEMMNDEKIRAFIKGMESQGVGVYGHMCLNEFGGPGSYDGVELGGNSSRIEQIRNSLFPNAMVKDKHLQDIISWEGCKVMNPDRRYGFFSYLLEQLRAQLERLPEIKGFIVDRLDWSSIYDYGHDDGLTMIGEKSISSMAVPMAEIVQEFCRINHDAGKRVFINHSYRIEVLRDVDGYCYEIEFLPALSYLAPYRPVSAWNFRKNYHGDLFQFEAQLKRRLQFAVFPHMIAHEFPICQQPPDRRAADFLEIYAPLFSTLLGKEQVLLAHCVTASGANDVNLYINGDGNYVVPVTSRVRFLSRRVPTTESVIVSLHVQDGAALKWAHVYSADGPVCRASVMHDVSEAQVEITNHGSASVLVVGKGHEPALDKANASRIERLRENLFPQDEPTRTRPGERPSIDGAKKIILRVEGTQVGEWGAVSVHADGKKVGEITSAFGTFDLPSLQDKLPPTPPQVNLVTPDEGMWFVPQRLEMIVAQPDGQTVRVAEWTPEKPAARGSSTRKLKLPLEWCKAESAQLK